MVKLKHKKILIVEDDRVSQEFLKEILCKYDTNLIFSRSGEDAIKTFASNPDINLVLMDIRLPGLDGYEITKILKSSNPSLPVIAQTAYAMEGDREKALNAGCDEYISKPIRPSELIDKISQFL